MTPTWTIPSSSPPSSSSSSSSSSSTSPSPSPSSVSSSRHGRCRRCQGPSRAHPRRSPPSSYSPFGPRVLRQADSRPSERAGKQTDGQTEIPPPCTLSSSLTHALLSRRRDTYTLLRLFLSISFLLFCYHSLSLSLSFSLSLSLCVCVCVCICLCLALLLSLSFLAIPSGVGAYALRFCTCRASFSTLPPSLSSSLSRVTSRSRFPSRFRQRIHRPRPAAAYTYTYTHTQLAPSLALSLSVPFPPSVFTIARPVRRSQRRVRERTKTAPTPGWLARSLVRTAASSVSLTRRQTNNVGVSRHDGIARAHGRTRHATARHGTARHGTARARGKSEGPRAYPLTSCPSARKKMER